MIEATRSLGKAMGEESSMNSSNQDNSITIQGESIKSALFGLFARGGFMYKSNSGSPPPGVLL